MNPSCPQLIDESAAAQRLGISRQKLQAMRFAGQIDYVRIGFRSIRYNEEALADFVRRATTREPDASQLHERIHNH